MTSAMLASIVGCCYQGSVALVLVVEVLLRGLGVDQPDELGLRLRLRSPCVTTTLTTMSTTNAAPAATKLAPWPRAVSTAVRRRAERVLAERRRPGPPPGCRAPGRPSPRSAVIRFQNMPRMNVANSGALKNPNSVCR